MSRRLAERLLVFLCALAGASPAVAHPAPFSYLDVRLAGTALQGTLVLHDFDVAHELKLAAPEPLLDPATLASYAPAIKQLVIERRMRHRRPRDPRDLIGEEIAHPHRTVFEHHLRRLLGDDKLLFDVPPVKE